MSERHHIGGENRGEAPGGGHGLSSGYSRLMGADEEGTLEHLKALRREIVDPKVAEHHGPTRKTE